MNLKTKKFRPYDFNQESDLWSMCMYINTVSKNVMLQSYLLHDFMT